jgi:hypothetical protein
VSAGRGSHLTASWALAFGTLRRVFYSINRLVNVCKDRSGSEITRKQRRFRRTERREDERGRDWNPQWPTPLVTLR